MQRSSSSNRWSVQMYGQGSLIADQLYSTPSDNFASASSASAYDYKDLWAHNAAVLGKSPMVLVQPSDFMAGASHYVSVFFTTVQDVESGGEVIVDAPLAFAFNRSCAVQSLSNTLYDVTDASGSVRELPDIGGCLGVPGPNSKGFDINRARIRLLGRLMADRTYAFQLGVTNAESSAVTTACSWYVWTADASGYVVDGTLDRADLAASLHSCWQLYSQSWPRPPLVYVRDHYLRPYRAFRDVDILIVSGIMIPTRLKSIRTSLRVLAPPSCTFRDPSVGGFELVADGSTAELPHAPRIGFAGELLWTTLHLVAEQAYGFQASMEVHDQFVRSGMHAFILELGFNATRLADRIGALTVPAAPLKAIVVAPVDYLSSRLGFRRNVLVFHFWTSSAVPLGQDAALVIQGHEGVRGSSLACWADEAVAFAAQLPPDVTCESGVDLVGAPFLRLRPSRQSILPGYYAVKVQASNPIVESTLAVSWSVSSFTNMSTPLSTMQIDAAGIAQGFSLRRSMHSALSAWTDVGHQYENRPGRASVVSFAFQLMHEARPQPFVDDLIVRVPRGFQLRGDCLSSVGIAPRGADKWVNLFQVMLENKSLPVSTCLTSADRVVLTLPSGLQPATTYGLSLAVVNPRMPPSLNSWSIECGPLTSEPLQGFPLAIVTFIAALTAVSVAAGSTVAAPVSVSFMLQHALAGGGKLLLTSPQGYTLHNATMLRPQRMAVDVGSLLFDAPASVSHGAELAVLVGEFAVPAFVPYMLQVFVTNPVSMFERASSTWKMASFNASGTALDEGEVVGYSLCPAAQLSVQNVEGNLYSMHSVLISIRMISPVAVLVGDRLLLEAPEGFALVGSKPPLCSGFQWLAWFSPAPQPLPTCSCAYGPCQLVIDFDLDWKVAIMLRGSAYNASSPIEFWIRSSNAARDPEVEQQFWRMSHVRGEVQSPQRLAMAVQRSWHIQPLLQSPSVQLVGTSQAAGSESSVLIKFVPVSLADVMWLVAEYPKEMSFENARIEAPLQKDSRSKGTNLIVFNLKLEVGTEASVLAVGVRLGRGGGQSIFNLATYKTVDLQEKVDERLQFMGFYQPGRAQLSGALRSKYAMQPELYPVRASFPARAGEETEATFDLMFSYALYFGDRLILTCEGAGAYTIVLDARFMLFRVALDASSKDQILVTGSALGASRLEVLFPATSKSGASSSLANVVLEAAQTMQLITWLVPTFGINSWRVETRSGQRLTNTNDGNSAGFAPVAQLQVLMQAQRSPPKTTVEVLLKVSPAAGLQSNIMVPEILLIAPIGFSFPALCGDLCTSRGDTFGSTGQAVAVLTSPGTNTLLEMELAVMVTTPDRTPLELIWVIQANGVAEQVAGWGDAESFKINQMRDTAVYYAGIPSMRVQVAFLFTLSVQPFDEQLFTIIDVIAPEGFEMSCQDRALWKLSLPGGIPVCQRDGAESMRLLLNETLRAGSYSFVTEAVLPASMPTLPTFAVAVRENGAEAMVDAAFDVPGWPSASLLVTQPTLAWSTAGYGQLSSVTITLTFNNATDALLSFLISLPPGFKQLVRTAADVKSSNSKLPLLKGGQDWVDASQPGRLRIMLEASDPLVSVGSYRFAFPVEMPESSSAVARLNVWYFCLCKDRSSIVPGEAGVLAAFPMAGFLPGEVSALEQYRSKTALGSVIVSGSLPWVQAPHLMCIGAILFCLMKVIRVQETT
mmetsp:Transcript_40564/g.128494  ORF Transcript_40564/g.128494 Transcript_40564/m.128494 type:complete len:1697 (+) Transcript_40564:2365-7455(+)